MKNKALNRMYDKRIHMENMLVEYWKNLIELNTNRDDTETDLKRMVINYIQSMSHDQVEDDNIYLDLKEYED